MDERILAELRDIKVASNRMIQHIDYVENHISWVQKLIVAFTPSLSRFFSKVDEKVPFDDVV